MDRLQIYEKVLGGLMHRYRERVPDVAKVFSMMKESGLVAAFDDIENDHIAFRTMGVEHLGLASLEKIFLHYGYEKRDAYFFEKKKLDAFWYSPPRDDLPRIFISELRVEDLSDEAQRTIRSYTDEVQSDPVDALDLDDWEAVDRFLHQALWRVPTWSDYSALLDESEYAAWVIYNRYYLNHFTITIHNLPERANTIAKFNDFLESGGVQLNDSGSKIKVSKDGKLLQSSTVAEMIPARFADGRGGEEEHVISGSYVEFAERLVLDDFAELPGRDIQRQHRRDGFDSGNADRIFESTFQDQTQKRQD